MISFLALSAAALTRPASLLPTRPATDVLLYVDPMHEQEHVEAAIARRGAAAVLLSTSRQLAGCELGDGRVVAAVPAAGFEASWAAQALPSGHRLRGVLCGDDASLEAAERLAQALCPEYANGILPARRDKYLMNEVLRGAGVPAVSQLAPNTWAEARDFLRGDDCGLPAVLKPRRGVASILVGLAYSEEEAEGMYRSLDMPSSPGADGEHRTASLVVQQFLTGDEWIVDTVSRDGKHKVRARGDEGATTRGLAWGEGIA